MQCYTVKTGYNFSRPQPRSHYNQARESLVSDILVSLSLSALCVAGRWFAYISWEGAG